MATKRRSENILLYFEPFKVPEKRLAQPAQGFPFRVQVKKLRLGTLYDNAKVIMRQSDYSVKFSRKGSWAIRPNQSASDLMFDVLRENLKVRALKERYLDESPQYVISGEILSIEEDLRSGDRNASLCVLLTISRYANEETVFEKKYRQSAACDGPGYAPLAKTCSELFKAVLEAFMADAVSVLNQELKAQNEKNQGPDL
jgi:hypothetical protein